MDHKMKRKFKGLKKKTRLNKEKTAAQKYVAEKTLKLPPLNCKICVRKYWKRFQTYVTKQKTNYGPKHPLIF